MTINFITSSKQFESIVNSDQLNIVEFYSEWCKPCRYIAPKIEKLSCRFSNISFYKINVSSISDTSIRVLPTFRFYKKGYLLSEITGARLWDIIDEIHLNRKITLPPLPL